VEQKTRVSRFCALLLKCVTFDKCFDEGFTDNNGSRHTNFPLIFIFDFEKKSSKRIFNLQARRLVLFPSTEFYEDL
jgi:hypothetical protein